MTVRVLSIAGCPNVAVLQERLAQLVAGPVEVEVEVEVIESVADAAEAGMCGSPTVLVDGVDPFAVPGRTPSVSCRLYQDESGDLVGAPTLDQLRAALAPG